MDNIDTLVKGSERTSARTDAAEVRSNGQTQGASFNAQATSSYLVLLSKQRGLLSEGLSRTLNSLAGTLNEYLKDPASVQSQNVDLSSSELGQYRRLSEQVINRDANLQEKVAQNLSTSHRLVRSRDAAAELSKSMQNLPESLREGTQAGKALSRFICESLVDLTDPKSMGAGLERDLAVRSVFVPKTPLNTRSFQATTSVLSSSIAYIESNQPEILRNLKPEEPQAKDKAAESSTTTPQAMTRYLRQALNEFPDDSTYLDIFKQNRDHKKEEPYQDKLSKETAERIHALISRAAETAKRGNLINRNAPAAQANFDTVSPTAKAVNHNPTEQINQRARQLSPKETADARELSLSELSARAAKLQQQFREERQRLAGEGKLPNPAEHPRPVEKAVARTTAPVQTVEPKASITSVAKQSSDTVAESVLEKAPPKRTSPQADTESINKIAPKVSYQGIQNSAFSFGSLASVPGQTMAFNAIAIADSAQVQDLSGSHTLDKVLAQQEKLSADTPAPQSGTKAEAAPTKAEPILTSEEINALKALARHAQELQRIDMHAQNTAEQAPPAQQAVPIEQTSSPSSQEELPASQLAPEEEPLPQEEPQVSTEEENDVVIVDAEDQTQDSITAQSVEQPAPQPEEVISTEIQNPAVAQSSNIQGGKVQIAEPVSEKTPAPQVITPEEQAYAESAAQAAKREEAVADLTAQSTEEEELSLEDNIVPEVDENADTLEAEQQIDEEKLSVPPMPAQRSAQEPNVVAQDVIPELIIPEQQNTVAPMPSLTHAAPAVEPEGEQVNELAKLYSAVNQPQETKPGTAAQTQPTSPQAVQVQDKAAQTPQNLLLSTVPADELEDSEIPQDAKQQGADGKAGQLATATLDTSEELSSELRARPLSAPGAAAVTTGGSAPIPEPSVVEEQNTIRENTLFSRIVSLFGSKNKSENLTAQATEATMAAAGSGNSLSAIKGNPLDSMLEALRTQADNQDVPPMLRAEAQKFMQQLKEPVADLVAVNNWLNFVTGPISPSSPQALALHQWAFMLLCIRFKHIGKAIDKYLTRVRGEPLKESFDKVADALSNKGAVVLDMLEETLDEVSRLQKLTENREPDQVFPRYIPLPPNYSGGREGSMSIRREQEEDGKKSWHMSFNFDLPGLGPIEIKAVAKLPELRLSVVAETLSGLQRVQECLPLLTKELQKAGITTRTANARLGRIVMQNDPLPEHPVQTESAEGSGLSVEI